MPDPKDIQVGREHIEQFKKSLEDVQAAQKKIDKALADFGSLPAELKEQFAALEKKNNEAADKMIACVADLAAAKQEQVRLDGELKAIKQLAAWKSNGNGAPQGELSFGQRFVESQEYKKATFTGRIHFSATLPGRLFPERKANPFIGEGTSGIVLFPQRVAIVQAAPQLPLVMRDLCTVVPLTTGNAIEYVIENWTYNADYQVLEGDKKAQGDVTYTDKTANVRTIAWFVKISRQMLMDVPYVQSVLDQRLLYGIGKKEDHEILWGDNAAGHLNGIMPQVPGLPVGAAPDTRIDEIAMAITYLTNLGYPPTAIVLNALDWGSMMLSKNTMGGYILGGPPLNEAQPRLWGLPVVTTPAMTQGTYLVGMFPGNATIFDREQASVDVSFENEDDFVRNLATFRAEERITLAVFLPTAFVKGPFVATAPPLFAKQGNHEEAMRQPVHEPAHHGKK